MTDNVWVVEASFYGLPFEAHPHQKSLLGPVEAFQTRREARAALLWLKEWRYLKELQRHDDTSYRFRIRKYGRVEEDR